MRILVTGGAGYVGSVSVEAFLGAGHDVTVLDDLSTGHRGAVPPGGHVLNLSRMTRVLGLRRALSELAVLETFVPICAQCKRIRDEQGVWQRLETYFGQHAKTQFSHSYCPECARKAIQEAGLGPAPNEP